jgi:predicted phosphodiesterase
MSKKVQKQLDKVVSISDTHFGIQDQNAINTVLSFVRHEKPQTVVLNGDILDTHSLSDFLKDPTRSESFKDEVEMTKDFLASLRMIVPNATIKFIEGNHEDRLRKFLWKHPSIFAVKELTFQSLLQLDQLNIEWFAYGEHYIYKGCVFTHGSRVSKSCALDNLQSYGNSGTSGHTHRLSMSSKTVLGRTLYWVESGCLCSLKPDFIKGVADWQHGFAFGWCVGSDDNLILKPMRVVDSDVF